MINNIMNQTPSSQTHQKRTMALNDRHEVVVTKDQADVIESAVVDQSDFGI